MKLVNPKATKESKELYAFLYSLKGKKTISAQHDFISSETKYCSSITTLTDY